MQIIHFTRMLAATTAMFLLPFALSAQENKKEIHIKIVENGKVTKDTVYNVTGNSPEDMVFADIENPARPGDGRYIREKHVYIIDDSTMQRSNFLQQEGEDKDVKVIVRNGHGGGDDMRPEVEEIWIDKNGEGKPCKTIIIHEGDCPEHLMPPPPPHAGKGPGNVEKTVVKSGSGKTVTIVETEVDKQEQGKPDKKNKK